VLAGLGRTDGAGEPELGIPRQIAERAGRNPCLGITERLAVQIMSTPPHRRASLGAAHGHAGSASVPTTTAPYVRHPERLGTADGSGPP
jgi:hypothetical protein